MTAGGTGSEQKLWTPSNIITLTRILLVPVFVAVLLTPWPEWIGVRDFISPLWKNILAAVVFVIISATDWLDGYLARSRNEITDFGKFMDPLADKILVSAALIALVELGALPTWVVLVILAREFIVSGVRMMAATKGEVIAASMLGKFKTVFQMVAIVLFTVKDAYVLVGLDIEAGDFLWVLSWVAMAAALVLTVASLVDYLYKARDILGIPSAGKRGEAPAPPIGPEEVVREAADKGLLLATAESLTGGLIGSRISSVPGASAVFLGGVMSYANRVKHDALDVSWETLEQFGAVSEPVSEQMASGVLKALGADIAVAVTGLAGPDGDDFGNPVGTVWLAVATKSDVHATRLSLSGTREEIRSQTADAALAEFHAAIGRF